MILTYGFDPGFRLAISLVNSAIKFDSTNSIIDFDPAFDPLI